MAAPTEPILVIATDNLGGDGFVSKVAPVSPVTNEGYGKQSLNYQQLNYMFNNQAQWLKYINEEQVPEEATTRDDEDTAIRATLGTPTGSTNMGVFTGTVLSDNASTKTGMQLLETAIDTITSTTIPAVDDALQDQIDTIETAVQVSGTDATIVNNLTVSGSSATVNSYNVLTDIANSFAANGYQKLSNGFLIQWGSISVSGDAAGAVTWPVAFPNTCLQAVVSHGTSADISDGNSTSVRIYNLTTTGSSINNDSPSTTTARYIAIGH